MKTFVVYPSSGLKKDSRYGYSTGSLTLATIAKECGEVRYADITLTDRPSGVENTLLEEIAVSEGEINVVVYFDSVPLHRCSNVESARQFCISVSRVNPRARVIACGPYCMIRRTPESCSTITLMDEPELVLKQALYGEGIGYPGQRVRLLESLASLPIPDRGLLPCGADLPRNAKRNAFLAKSAVVSTTRGCSGTCTFCPRRAWTQGRVRHRPIPQIVEEIAQLIERGTKNIWIDDDNVGADPEWAIDLFAHIAQVNEDRQCGFYLSAWGSVSTAFMHIAKQAGVRIISFGLESGSPRVLDYFAKQVTVQQMRDAITNADRIGIFTVANVIVGAPCEEPGDLQMTADFLMNNPVDQVNIKILSYIMGASLWKKARSRGLISPADECVFADVSQGTSNRSLDVLHVQQHELMNRFMSDSNHRRRVQRKINAFGVPYILTGASLNERHRVGHDGE